EDEGRQEAWYRACFEHAPMQKQRRADDGDRGPRRECELLADISHELRTPLNSIIGFTELVYHGKAGTVSTLQREFLGDVISSARQLLQLLTDVVDLARIGSGEMEFRMQRVDLGGLIAEVHEVIAVLARKKQSRIETEVAIGVEEIVADASRLKQVL